MPMPMKKVTVKAEFVFESDDVPQTTSLIREIDDVVTGIFNVDGEITNWWVENAEEEALKREPVDPPGNDLTKAGKRRKKPGPKRKRSKRKTRA